MTNAGIREGDIVAGRYRVRAILGRGRGILALADHTGFDQKVAVRVVSSASPNRTAIAKLQREGNALARLSSEHAARILDMGAMPDGSLFLVRQYLEGSDLATVLSKRGALPLREAVGWILQATEAVAEAHAHGILHRDLSPACMFLAERSPGVRGGPTILKVIDFGTAKLTGPALGATGEQTTVVSVSPYSSPEVLARASDLDARTDIWSLGAVLYEMLCGRPPFGRDPLRLPSAITQDAPTPLSGLNPDVPAELESAIERALAKNRDERPVDAHAFAASLARFAPADSLGLMERIQAFSASARARNQGFDEPDEIEISQVEEVEEVSNVGEEPTGEVVLEASIVEADDEESTGDADDEESTGDNEDEATRVARPSAIAAGMAGRAVSPIKVTPPAPTSSDATRTVLKSATSPTQGSTTRGSSPPVALDKLPAPPRADDPSRGGGRPKPATQEKTEALGFGFVPTDPLLRRAAAELASDRAPGPRQVARKTGPVFAGAAAGSRAGASEPTAMLPASSPPPAKAQQAPASMRSEITSLPAFRPPAGLAMQNAPVVVPSQGIGAESVPPPPPSAPWPQGSPTLGPPPPERESFGRKVAMYAIGGGVAMIVILVIALIALLLGERH
ncbi:MAG: protein kinase [Polyangiaceae bacterium]|nr:protein kinase [Polyangiaceae bacterium]